MKHAILLCSLVACTGAHALDTRTTVVCGSASKTTQIEIFDELGNGRPVVNGNFAIVSTTKMVGTNLLKSSYVLPEGSYSRTGQQFVDQQNKVTYSPCISTTADDLSRSQPRD